GADLGAAAAAPAVAVEPNAFHSGGRGNPAGERCIDLFRTDACGGGDLAWPRLVVSAWSRGIVLDGVVSVVDRAADGDLAQHLSAGAAVCAGGDLGDGAARQS